MSSTGFGVRIGSAAFAMGVGVAIASNPAVAVADGSDSGSAASSSASSKSADKADSSDSPRSGRQAVGSSRRAAQQSRGATDPQKRSAGKTSATRPPSAGRRDTRVAPSGESTAVTKADSAARAATTAPGDATGAPPATTQDLPVAAATPATAPVPTSAVTPARHAASAAIRPSNVVSGFLSLLGLTPGTGLPSSPAQLLTGALSLVRREIEAFVKQVSALLPPQLTHSLSAGTKAIAAAGTTTTITWAWGSNPVLAFNPATDKLDFGWMQANQFTVVERSGSVVIGVVDNNHSYTLQGVTLGQLQMSNIVAKDAGTVAKWQSLISGAQTALPSVSVSDATVTEGNSGTTNAAFTITLSKAGTKPVTVSYTTANGTATAGQDYTASTGTVTFAAGQVSQVITIAVHGDTAVEPTETFTLTLSNPSGATIGRATATGTITNDDAAPVLPSASINDATVAEGNSGTRNLAFTVTLSKASTTTVTLNYTTANGTATAGQDYTAASGTITFAPGVTSQVITIAVLGDTAVEPTETFTVTLSNASGATIADGSAIGTITNDDTATTPGGTGTAQWGKSFFAPYVDMGAWPVPDLLALSKTYGHSLVTLGFMQADQNGNLAWAGLAALEPNSTNEQAIAINDSIAKFKAAGGDVMISFGGASGTSIAQVYAAKGKSAQELADAYAAVIDKYGVTHIDFDIEGAAVADPASIALNSQALALLQQAKPDIHIWYTLPVLPSGLTADGVNVVDAAVKAGVKLDGVNVMAMDYGESAAPTSGPGAKTMGQYAIDSAQSTYNQLSTLYGRYGQSFTWSQIGVTPMLGVNDVLTEVFTVADAQALEDFARTKGIGMLSMWQVLRDTPGTVGQASTGASGLSDPAGSFNKVFNDYGTVNVVDYSGTGGTGGTGGAGGTGGTGTPVTGGTTTTITWGWGSNPVLAFDPAKDTLDFVWMQPTEFDVTENAGSVVISVVGNNHTYTLQGVSLRQLQAGNIIAKDAGTLAKWQSLIAAAKAV